MGLWRRLGLRCLLWTAAVLFVWQVLPRMWALGWPLAVGFGLASLLERPLVRLGRLGLPRALGAAALVAALTAPVAALGWGLGKLIAGGAGEVLGALPPLPDWVAQWARESLLPLLAGFLAGLAADLPGLLVGLGVLLVATWAFSAGYPQVRRALVGLVPRPCREFCAGAGRIALGTLWRCLRAEAILSALVFLTVTAGLLLLGQPWAPAVALGVALVDFVPVLGSGTVLVPWALVTALAGRWQRALALLGLWGAATGVRELAQPRVVAGRTGLSPAASVAAVYLGLRLFGLAGIFLGPVAATLLWAAIRAGAFAGTVEDVEEAVEALGRMLGQ